MISFIKNIFLISLMSSIAFVATATTADTQTIRHQGSKDGLTRIDENGVYYYDTPNPLKNQSFHVKAGMATNPELGVLVCQKTPTDDCASQTEVTFDDLYKDASSMTIGFDYDYFLSVDYGKIGLQGGLFFQYASGRGRVASDPTQESQEKFSFLTVPAYVGLTYRFEYKDKQIFAPYVSGGGVYIGLIEKREDKSDFNSAGGLGFYGAGGILVNVTAFDRDLANDFYSEYEIGNMWINLEFRVTEVSAEIFNYSAQYVQGGISFDY